MSQPSLQLLSILLLADSIRMQSHACDQTLGNFITCTGLAYKNYQSVLEAGEDGRPDWLARKSCNYMTDAAEECGNKLAGQCYEEEEVMDRKDDQLKGILSQLETSVEGWDSDKCPAVKAHIDRMRGEDDDEWRMEMAQMISAGSFTISTMIVAVVLLSIVV
eukprot:GFUD01073963.1.p1 GENE.GFUD01073963.1~~GFUD01073963.1.p1  ORF type:complete len:162 (-),score=54.72 GFUD01073963.1:53-538(-)